MNKTAEFVAALLREVQPLHPVPAAPREGVSLLEQGAILVLLRHLTQRQAEASVESLRAAYGDWNEARVSQVQELATHLKSGSRKRGVDLLRELSPASRTLKAYLQDVFQVTHGLDLEFLREDTSLWGKTVSQLTVLGMTGTAYLLWLAGGGQVPVHPALMRILDRLGLMARTGSVRKARAALETLVPEGKELEFTIVFHEIIGRWNDPREPIYMTVEALRSCPYGKKAYQDRVVHVRREKERRRKEALRRVAAEKREAERQVRERERSRKRAEAEARRRAREMERRRKAEERKREAERRKKELERERVAAVKKKAAAKKKAEARKKAEAKKMVAAKKKAEARRKAASKKKAAAKKKGSARKPAAKKPAARKKAATGKRSVRNVGAKKPAAKKATAKKATAKKATAKKATAKKGGAKKAASKKAAPKKAGAKKAGAGKAGRRR